MTALTPPAIAPAGGWEVMLLEVGTAIHPGQWVGPGFPAWMWSPMNALLLRRPGRTVLVDTGSGLLTPLWPFEGIRSDLTSALSGVGVVPDEIDLVVLSHLDDDHIGGLLTGTWPTRLERALPSASVVAPAAALDAARAAEPETPQHSLVALLERDGALTPFAGGDEPAPGLRVWDAPGHRVGHAIVEVVDADDPLLHLCDALHNLAHVEHPEWDREADSEPDTALATRTALLQRCVRDGARAIASHIAGPHAFRIEERGDGTYWATQVPAESAGRR